MLNVNDAFAGLTRQETNKNPCPVYDYSALFHCLRTTDVTLAGDQARYIGRALRLKPGDGFTVFDGAGGEYPATVATVGKTQVQISIATLNKRNAESPLAIHLLQGISRGERMDFVVQKSN